MFNPDKPIQSYKQDLLGRSLFAQNLGNAILSYDRQDSVVIGLFGAWGTGKTSIINIALEHIKTITQHSTMDRPIVIKFNPWLFSDQNQLINEFFNQMSVVLRRKDHAKDAQKAGKKLQSYATFFEPLTVIPTVGLIANIVATVFKSVGTATKSWGDLKACDLTAIRDELNTLLANQPHKIIVVIDDIDRLNNVEIRQVFQLVKSLGDFPNTVYLLAFDKDVVVNALAKVQEGSGSDYLEKVIQVPFEIPIISGEEVEKLLFNQLDVLLKNLPKNRWNQTYWGNIYFSALKLLFTNIRDVTRYTNALNFSFPMVKNEVNPIDFFAIVALQTFIPEVYYFIRDNKESFAGAADYGYRNSVKQKDEIKKMCDEKFEKVSHIIPVEHLNDMLKRIFPKLESIYGNTYYGNEWLQSWRKDGRICSPDLFEIFFRLTLPKGEILQIEIEKILTLGDNVEEFRKTIIRFNEEGRIIRFLERLEDYTQEDIDEGIIEHIITVLMDVGDLFPEGETSFYGTDTPMRLFRIFFQLSHRFDEQDKRFNIFKNAIEKSKNSIYTIVHEIGVQDQQHGKYGSREKPEPADKQTVSSEQLEVLEKLACTKIEEWAYDGRLALHKNLVAILFMWRRWGQANHVTMFVADLLKTDDGLIEFITRFLTKSISHGLSDYVGKTNWRIDMQSVGEFTDLKTAEQRLRKIRLSPEYDNFMEQQKLAISIFLDTFDGKIKDFF